MAIKRICGMWWRKSGDGRQYLSGQIQGDIPDGAKVQLYSNKGKKKNEKSPDCDLCMIVPDEPQQQQFQQAAPPSSDDVPF